MAEDEVEYTFEYRGAYTGDVTGRRYLYKAGQSFTAPEGEFRGMDSSRYQTRPLKPQTSTSTEAAAEDVEEGSEEGIHHIGAGWYQVRVGGEVLDKKRGKDAAQERYQELTEE